MLEVQHSVQDISNLFVSDASESHAFVYCADGTFAYVSDFEFSAAEANLSLGHRELLAIAFALDKHPDVFRSSARAKYFGRQILKTCLIFYVTVLGSRRSRQKS